MPYGRYNKQPRTRYRPYKRTDTMAERPDMWIQSMGAQIAYEKARLDYHVCLRKENYVYSKASYMQAEQRLQTLFATLGSYLGLGRALDGFHDLEAIGTPHANVQADPFYHELLRVKYHVTNMAKVNTIRIRTALLMEIYHECYLNYSQRLNALPKIPTPTHSAMAVPDADPARDPRFAGTAMGGVQFEDDPTDLTGLLPNKWISTAPSLIEGSLHDQESQAAKRQMPNTYGTQ